MSLLKSKVGFLPDKLMKLSLNRNIIWIDVPALQSNDGKGVRRASERINKQ